MVNVKITRFWYRLLSILSEKLATFNITIANGKEWTFGHPWFSSNSKNCLDRFIHQNYFNQMYADHRPLQKKNGKPFPPNFISARYLFEIWSLKSRTHLGITVLNLDEHC